MIRCFDGLLGQGKTYGMVDEAVQLSRKEHPMVYTNMAGLQFPEAVYFDHIEELCNISSGLVLLDEALIVVPARFWQEMGRDLLGRFAQLRKHGLDLWYTSQFADGVDKTLRELTNEVVTCQKVGKTFFRRKSNPTQKVRGLGWPHRFDPDIANLYNTLEVIKTTGGSAGVAERNLLLSVVARKRSEDAHREEQARAASAARPLLHYPWYSALIGDHEVLSTSKRARAAIRWLKERDYWSHGLTWSEQVRRELERRQWLSLFNLGPEDAPYYCTRSNPWLGGQSPEAVRERRALLEHQRAAETLVLTGERVSRTRKQAV